VPNALIAVHHKSQRLGQEWLTLTLSVNQQKLIFRIGIGRSVTDSISPAGRVAKRHFPHKFSGSGVGGGLSRLVIGIRLYWNIEVAGSTAFKAKCVELVLQKCLVFSS